MIYLFRLITVLIILLIGCKPDSQHNIELIKYYPIDSYNILSKSETSFDENNSSDGNGSIRIEANSSKQIRLYETGDFDIENCRITYQAKLKSEDLIGQAYLEMWCVFEGKGEYFSKSLQFPISGTTEWSSQETPFFLKKGENPTNIKLNVVIEGKGTLWVDQIKLLKGPL